LVFAAIIIAAARRLIEGSLAHGRKPRQPRCWVHPGWRRHRRTRPAAHRAPNVVDAIQYTALAALIGA
jgi:hypothetical protein